MTPSGSSARSFLSIGEVLAQLRPEFPDTTISKLRFLESEGLVEPERTPAGYRKYSTDDVDRLRYVLAAQRDQYLPLRVIREHLQGRGGSFTDERPALVDSETLPTAGDFSRPEVDVRLSRTELLERTGITDAQLKQIESHGLVTPRGAGWYDADGVVVAETVARMAEFGLEPRHLRGYRTAADREVGLFEQVVAPVARQRGPEAKARAEETVRELAALSLRLHTALVQARLRGALGG